MQTVERGDIFGTPDGEIVRVFRVGRAGWVTVRVIGGPNDGAAIRRQGIPDDWARYPRP